MRVWLGIAVAVAALAIAAGVTGNSGRGASRERAVLRQHQERRD